MTALPEEGLYLVELVGGGEIITSSPVIMKSVETSGVNALKVDEIKGSWSQEVLNKYLEMASWATKVHVVADDYPEDYWSRAAGKIRWKAGLYSFEDEVGFGDLSAETRTELLEFLHSLDDTYNLRNYIDSLGNEFQVEESFVLKAVNDDLAVVAWTRLNYNMDGMELSNFTTGDDYTDLLMHAALGASVFPLVEPVFEGGDGSLFWFVSLMDSLARKDYRVKSGRDSGNVYVQASSPLLVNGRGYDRSELVRKGGVPPTTFAEVCRPWPKAFRWFYSHILELQQLLGPMVRFRGENQVIRKSVLVSRLISEARRCFLDWVHRGTPGRTWTYPSL